MEGAIWMAGLITVVSGMCWWFHRGEKAAHEVNAHQFE